jgi:predicted RNase H-like HicB family nuclease
MSAQKTLEKILRGDSDTSIRFEELAHLLEAKGFRMRISGSHHILLALALLNGSICSGRFESEIISSTASPQNFSAIQAAVKNNNYEMIIWWSEEDNAFVVDVPELPGCMAHGNTRVPAIKNAEDAIAFWIKTAKEDGLQIPEPKGRLMFA